MPEFDAAWRRLLIWVGAIVSGLFLISEFIRELNPLTGFWEPSSLIIAGQDSPGVSGIRTFLTVRDGNAQIANYWTCGVVEDSLAEGRMVDHGHDIALHHVDSNTEVMEALPSAHLTRVQGVGISFDAFNDDGDPITIVFKRTENARTIFDLVGWK